MPLCRVCTSPDNAAIMRDLRSGSLAEVASRWSLSKAGLHRHLQNHTPHENAEKRSNVGPNKAKRGKSGSASRSGSNGDPDPRCPTCGILAEGQDLSPADLIRRAERLLYFAETRAMRAHDDDSRDLFPALDKAQKFLEQLMRVHNLVGPDSVTVIDNRSISVDYSSWEFSSLQAVQTFHDTLNSGASIQEAIEAVLGQQKPALPPG